MSTESQGLFSSTWKEISNVLLLYRKHEGLKKIFDHIQCTRLVTQTLKKHSFYCDHFL